jgi:diguanylate cyclase (GGDEF)-like protein
MVSANDADDAIIGAIDVGAHDYIAKPFIYPVLAARMRSALRLKESQEALKQANLTLSKLASLDPLTEVYNRRYFFDLARAEFAKSRRHHRPLSVIMLDVDHFKLINDNFGHGAGDQALVKLTQYCRDNGRESDILARFGGEEFAICCADTDSKGALALAERIRQAIEEASFDYEGNTITFSVSMGVTSLQPGDQEFEALINRADKLLYQAKDEGRNRCISDTNC